MKKKPKAPKHRTASKRTQSSEASTSSKVNPSKWIRTDRPFTLPAYVKEALQRLDDAGHIAYVVGGSVRDFLLGREAKDHDIATSASPDELCLMFPNAVTVGKSFGVLKIPVAGETFLEIATFRKDLEYRDHRHPTGILIAGPAEDARRRDFTINALFYDSKTSRILDSVGGLVDLRAGIVRAIGTPMERFREDALRLLRAVRFSTALDFKLDPDTAHAVKSQSRLISKVSGERMREEINLMLTGPRPVKAIQALSELGLLSQILPELESLKGVKQSPLHHPEGDVWVHTLKSLDTLTRQNPSRSVTLVWGTLLHDIGKPIAAKRSEGKNFNSHEIDGAKIARRVTDRFKLSRQESDTVIALIEDHLKFKDVFQMREATLVRFIRLPHFEELLTLHRADAMSSDGNLTYYEFCESRFAEMKKSPRLADTKLVDGEDLIQLGFKPGPKFSEILRTIEDLAIEKKLSSKEEALEYVIKHFAG